MHHPGAYSPYVEGWCALAKAYLKSGADRRAFQAAVAVTACKFQDDPHNQKITLSAYEEDLDVPAFLRRQAD